MTRKILSSLLIAFCSIASIHAQFSINRPMTIPHGPDSIDIAYYSKKHWEIATGSVVGLNMGIWAIDRYVVKGDYAYISINTMKDNITHGFVWDNDQMGTNMFLHPYHGNLYYNSARSNGYNYWQSGIFAFGGSAMWELFMENEHPSINDIIATPVGGMALGEILYRTADLVLDDRATGKERFGRELASFVLTPTQGLSRIITGDAWRRRSTSGKQFGVPDVSLEIAGGVQITELKDNILDKGVGVAMDINLEYGDRYASENDRPYDYCSMQSNFNITGGQPLLSQINVIGRLKVTELIDTEKDFLSIGAYQHFDYFDSDTISNVSGRIPYKFGTPASVGVGFIHKNKRLKNFDINSYFYANAILLGASLSDHYVVDKRNYNLGNGLSFKGGINVSYKDKIGFTALHETYRTFTWKGYPEGTDLQTADPKTLNAQGDKSQSTMHVTCIRAEMKVRNNIYLTGVLYNYLRETNYRYFEDVFSHTSEGRLLLTCKF